MNDSFIISGKAAHYSHGVTFDFLREVKKSQEACKLVYSAGRQLVIQEQVQHSAQAVVVNPEAVVNSLIVELEHPLKSVTCVKSQAYDRTQFVAIAEIYLTKPTTLFVSLYSQLNATDNSPAQQYEIKLPVAEVEESKDEKHHCHYHG